MENGAKDRDDRVSITIPFPVSYIRERGVHARGKFGQVLKVRASLDEKELVQAAAVKAGLLESELIRHAVICVAKEVLRDVHAQVPEPSS